MNKHAGKCPEGYVPDYSILLAFQPGQCPPGSVIVFIGHICTHQDPLNINVIRSVLSKIQSSLTALSLEGKSVNLLLTSNLPSGKLVFIFAGQQS